jgi:hypothetical protein
MADISDYPDAVRRIAEANVDPRSEARDAVLTDLAGSDSPQVTREVAANLADAILTAEDVLEGLDGRGELPPSSDVERVAGALDDYDLSDRVDSVSDAVEGEVVLEEDVDRAVAERERSKRSGEPVFREEVETSVDEAADGREFVGSSSDEVADSKAQDLGAPTESEFRQTASQALQGSRIETEEGSAFAVESVGGETVGVYGGTVDAREAAAAETGAENLGNVSLDDVEARQSTGQTEVLLEGQTVGEVDVS